MLYRIGMPSTWTLDLHTQAVHHSSRQQDACNHLHCPSKTIKFWLIDCELPCLCFLYTWETPIECLLLWDLLGREWLFISLDIVCKMLPGKPWKWDAHPTSAIQTRYFFFGRKVMVFNVNREQHFGDEERDGLSLELLAWKAHKMVLYERVACSEWQVSTVISEQAANKFQTVIKYRCIYRIESQYSKNSIGLYSE